MAVAAATLAQQGNDQARKESELKSLLAFTQNLETVLSTNSACVGVPGVIDGLKFDNGAGFAANQFNSALASQPTGQPVSLGTPLLHGSGRFVAAAGAAYTPSNILIDQLFIRNAVQVPASNTFHAQLVLQASVNNRGFAPREVGTVTLSLDGGNNLISCEFAQSAVAACEAMNCKFNSASPKQKCVCGFPQMSCQTSPGQPQQYISGINQTTSPPTPICSNFKVDCSDPAVGGKGPGYFLSGFDQNGDPICQPVEGAVAGPPVVCLGGATTTVTAIPASPIGCFCPAGETWNGSLCVPPLTCTGGATTTVTAVPATPAGCFCSAGQTWNGISCVAAMGPMTWQNLGGSISALAVWSGPLCSAIGAVEDAPCTLGDPQCASSFTPPPLGQVFGLICSGPGANGAQTASAACNTFVNPGNANTVQPVPTTKCSSGAMYCSSYHVGGGTCVPPTVLTDPYTPGTAYVGCSGISMTPILPGPYTTTSGVETCAVSAWPSFGSVCGAGFKPGPTTRFAIPSPPVIFVYDCLPCAAGSHPPATCL